LRCPLCERDLAEAGPASWSLSCSTGHSFDANKRGYLNLVDRTRGITGDTREILQARDAFLVAGHYSPVAGLIGEMLPDDAGRSILDSGCGTGYYLARVLESRPDWQPLALDVSADAVAMTVRATGSAGVVSDVWRPLPVRDARADVVLCVFAPRNPDEFARVLRADGLLVVVTPAADHLAQLRVSGRLIGMQPDKLAHLDASLTERFTLVERRSLAYDVELGESAIRNLTGMGPSGHHAALNDLEHPDAAAVTVAVDVSVYSPR
jgi:23S rRNA (guanine745-N1)-methyltransferase